MTQIYIAYIAFCTLALAADATGHKGSLYEFANIMSVSLTEKVMLRDLLERYRRPQEEYDGISTPSLFDFDNLSDRTI